MIFKNINIIDENFEIIENGFLVTCGDKIEYVGKLDPRTLEKYRNFDFGREIDGNRKVVLPGFINSHAHSPMTLLRGYGENMKLQDWLFNRIFPFEEHLDSESVYIGTLLAMAESLRFGITSTSDMYFFMDDIAAAIMDSGAKANISRSISHFDDGDFITSYRATEMINAYKKYHMKERGKIRVDMSLHSEYTSNEIAVRQLAEYTKEIGAIMQVHVSETKLEVAECIARHGKSPVEYLAHHGLFDTKTVAAHCVWLDDNDIRILKEKDVSVASNPISNLKLASGVCNIGRLLDEGINLCLGTDSVASNNSLNFIEEMKILAISSKMMYNSPEKVSPLDVIKAATINGAKAQGREDTGVIKVGYKADLVVMDINKPNMLPIHNLLNNIVYSACGGDVVMTIVDGEILYENGDFSRIDFEKLSYDADRITKEILKKI